ncbi:Protein of unknown function [Clostridium cavendishii DSM 21758]|uniref:DUF4003 domain-containing protein n=1 Tax=Clostridium cavendishii DSM 21758 TaxID=1121302 RepID=A0A1M6CMC3_9CLOT|nr:DUF4003 family protein [Clostridium cavendishii]SHI61991.1 Protein of unknown function [Clostridium cavendishii DSM 21758]
MDEILKKKIDLMVENFHRLKNDFIWEERLVKHFAAMIHANNNKVVNTNEIRKTVDYIKEKTSTFSYFRGANKFIIANLLTFEEDYEDMFKKIENIYGKLKESGFKRSEYLPLAAYTIAKEASDDSQIAYRIERMSLFYESMKKNHWWLTSSDDYVLAAVLANTDLDVNETTNKIEECYGILKDKAFSASNDLQTLSHILALGDEDSNKKVNKAITLYEGLKNIKCKVRYSGLSSLGVLTLITDDTSKILKEVKEVYDYIYEKDGYGFWSLDKNIRIILVLNLISAYYVDAIKDEVLEITLANSINAILIAQEQAAMMACIAASAAASSASN